MSLYFWHPGAKLKNIALTPSTPAQPPPSAPLKFPPQASLKLSSLEPLLVLEWLSSHHVDFLSVYLLSFLFLPLW